jgi:hypothetical protein
MGDKIESREDLYNAVWSKPMMSLAEDFGISGIGLAKLCERLKVPIPPRGYWRKFSLGQIIKKTPFQVISWFLYFRSVLRLHSATLMFFDVTVCLLSGSRILFLHIRLKYFDHSRSRKHSFNLAR